MRKIEFVYREVLYQVLEKKNHSFTQKELSSKLNVSLSNVNHALKPLKRMNAVKVNPRNFSVVNAKKILFYWASTRNLQKDIVYCTRAEIPVKEIEKNMPADAVFAAYSGYKFRFNDAPADYSEVYVYASDLEEMNKRFPLAKKKNPNLFVLKKDELMEGYGKTESIGQLFVDLWNLPEWYARDFLKALEAKIDALLE
ncbi:hypothetical protein KJ660_01770 [Candidatus Micrarchaeota archaeon]|nr:hypothetical protein [Candidatus Micrarchaeota archaeon]